MQVVEELKVEELSVTSGGQVSVNVSLDLDVELEVSTCIVSSALLALVKFEAIVLQDPEVVHPVASILAQSFDVVEQAQVAIDD